MSVLTKSSFKDSATLPVNLGPINDGLRRRTHHFPVAAGSQALNAKPLPEETRCNSARRDDHARGAHDAQCGSAGGAAEIVVVKAPGPVNHCVRLTRPSA